MKFCNSNITTYIIILIMKKIAYLLGNGATMAELESKDHENRLHMDRIAEEVAEHAMKNNSPSHLSESLIESATMRKIDVEELERWDVHKVLEILHIDKIISNDDYVELNQLQKLRNDVIHEGQEVTQKRATTCFNLARDVINNITNLKNLS